MLAKITGPRSGVEAVIHSWDPNGGGPVNTACFFNDRRVQHREEPGTAPAAAVAAAGEPRLTWGQAREGCYYDRLFLNATLDERYRIQYPVYNIQFSAPGFPRAGAIPWDPKYLTAAGIEALVRACDTDEPKRLLGAFLKRKR